MLGRATCSGFEPTAIIFGVAFGLFFSGHRCAVTYSVRQTRLGLEMKVGE